MRRRFTSRLLVASVLALIGTVGAGAAPASAQSPLPTRHCAVGFCTEVIGAKAGEIWLNLAVENYTASYEACVNPPRGKTRCRLLFLTKGSLFVWHGDVRWADRFPRRGRGIYRVSWKQNGTQLGPTLGFKLG